eukprot:SM000019S05071  [mRNA]  locus=s19:777378:781010:- [translate_table: standard]
MRALLARAWSSSSAALPRALRPASASTAAAAAYVGAIDQGTTSTRFILYDAAARPVASHQLEHAQLYPRAGWVEHDPVQILANTRACMAEAVAKAGAAGLRLDGGAVRGIGITNQRETTVVWSRATGQPLHNAIVWMDVRTSDICRCALLPCPWGLAPASAACAGPGLTAGAGARPATSRRLERELAGGRDHFRRATGLPISTYFSATKLLWLLENVPAVKAAVDSGDAMFGTIDTWLVWHLTGGPGRTGAQCSHESRGRSDAACAQATDSDTDDGWVKVDHERYAATASPATTEEAGRRLSEAPVPNVPETDASCSSGGGARGSRMGVASQLILADFAVDCSNAARTMLMDLRTLQWHEPTLDTLGIPKAILPSIVSNSEIVGTVADPWPLAGVPISGCFGDQHAAMLGQRCRKGEAKSTYGTGCFILLNTGDDICESTHGLLTTISYKLGPKAPVHYALEGSIAIAGAAVQWLRDNLGIIKSSKDIEALARTVENTGGVYFVPAFSGLFAPHWRDDARGVCIGMTRYTNKAHIARSVLESMCFQAREVLEAMQKDAGVGDMKSGDDFLLHVDGGASSNDLLMQLQADLLGSEVVRPADVETTALGAALAAGLAVDVWTEEQIFGELFQGGQLTTFSPQTEEEQRERRFNTPEMDTTTGGTQTGTHPLIRGVTTG